MLRWRIMERRWRLLQQWMTKAGWRVTLSLYVYLKSQSDFITTWIALSEEFLTPTIITINKLNCWILFMVLLLNYFTVDYWFNLLFRKAFSDFACCLSDGAAERRSCHQSPEALQRHVCCQSHLWPHERHLVRHSRCELTPPFEHFIYPCVWNFTFCLKAQQIFQCREINKHLFLIQSSIDLLLTDASYIFVFVSEQGEWVSMGIYSSGNSYGVPDDLMYSFPVMIKVCLH